MDDILKRELETVDISEQQSTSENESSISNLEKQTRTRRLFSPVQLFFFNFVYMQLWYSTGGNMYFALANGGPAAWFFGYFIISFGALCQAASFAELASIQPLAGAQYYWTHHFAPESSKLFLTWLQGWTTWIAYIALLASCILNVCLFFVILVSVWVMTPKRNSADVFLITNVSTGWEGNYFVSANIGALSNIFLYLSFESIIHMGEESRNPKQAVPRAVLWSLLLNACLGVVMMVTFGEFQAM
ncbi:hypothetical protein TruAng_010579 [Truncatella angustata]|nr:hypothetical protein TruAng_010579 [Truncatella angustata]